MKIFLSYKWEDRDKVNGLKGTLLNPNNKYQHIPKTERNDYRSKGDQYIRNYLKNIVGECDAVICLLGNYTYKSQWVKYELEVANSQKKKILPVRIRGTNGKIPTLLKKWGIKTVKSDTKSINNALSIK